MKAKLKELNPNPFKKYINKGQYDEEKIEWLIASMKRTTAGYWDRVLCREHNRQYEICFGHHRIEAAKRLYGENYEVDIKILPLTDEEMLVNMANENLRKENRPIENMDLVMTVKRWLEEHHTKDVKQFTSSNLTPSYAKTGDQKHAKGIGSRQIAEFLLNKGNKKGNKAWSHVWINELLKCATLPDWIKEKSEYGETGGENSKGKITMRQMKELVKINDEPEIQEMVVRKIEEKRNPAYGWTDEVVDQIRQVDNKVKERIKNGEIELEPESIKIFRKHRKDERDFSELFKKEISPLLRRTIAVLELLIKFRKEVPDYQKVLLLEKLDRMLVLIQKIKGAK